MYAVCLRRGEALKVAVVMTVVATFSKWLAAWITQKNIWHAEGGTQSDIRIE